MTSKSIYLSKTLWFNVLFLVVLVARQYGYAEFVPHGTVEPLASMLAVPLINIVLRLVTKQAVALRPQTPEGELAAE